MLENRGPIENDQAVRRVTGTNGLGAGPTYSAVGRINRLSPRCSMMWAAQPVIRDATNRGVNIDVGMPQKWNAVAL